MSFASSATTERENVTAHDLDAERAVLGASLVSADRAAFGAVLAAGLSEGDFFRAAHRRIFRKQRELYDRNEPIDLVTLASALADSGELDESGGPAYLASLTDGVPRSANSSFYAGLVIRKSLDAKLEHDIAAALAIVRTEGGDAALDALAALVGDQAARGTAARSVSAVDLMTAPAVEPVLIEWPILCPSTISAVVASSGVGKTFLALHAASDFLLAGHRVVFVALEGLGQMRRRVAALAEVYGLRREHLERLVFFDQLSLDDPRSVRALIAAAGPAQLAIVDTFACGLGRLDENKSNDMALAIGRCREISRGLGGAAVLIPHHTNRASASERGSSAIRAALDGLAFLDDEGETKTLRVEKLRDGELPAPRRFRFRAVPSAGSVVLMDADSVLPAANEAELSPRTQDVLRELRLVGRAKTAEVVEAMKGRVSRSTIYGALESLESIGLARQERRGEWVAVCPISRSDNGPKSDGQIGQIPRLSDGVSDGL